MLATRTSRLTAGVAAACVALLAATWFLLIAPRRADAEAYRVQRVDAVRANDLLRNKVAELRAQAATLPQTKQELAKLRTQLTPTEDLPTLVRTISSLSTKAGVSLRSIKPGVPTALTGPAAAGASGVVAVPVTIEASGDYFQAVAFIRALQTDMTRVLLVKSIKIDSDDSTVADQPPVIGNVKLGLDGQVFVLSDGASPSRSTGQGAGAAPAAAVTAPAAGTTTTTTTSTNSSSRVSQ